MTVRSKHVVVMVTAPNLRTARKLAGKALEARVAACANLVPGIESHYWWQKKLERSSEVLIVFKTRSGLANRLERVVLEHHPYDTPEVIFLPVQGGNQQYLNWIDSSTEAPPPA